MMSRHNEGVQKTNVIVGIKERKKRIAANMETINEIKRNHPELYFWDHTSYFTEKSPFGECVILNYMYSDSECQFIEQRVKQIAVSCKTSSAEKTVRKIHNYLVRDIRYDYNGIGKPENHNAGGIFLYNKGVCEGIGKAFQWLCLLCGIECTVIEGWLAGGAHLWNVVKIGGGNYHVDVTQDIAATDKAWHKPSYMYYLVTDSEIRHDHSFTESFNCVNTEANPFYKAGKVFKSETELRRYLRSVPKRDRLVYFKYLGGLSKDSILQIAAAELQSALSMRENAGTYYLERTRV